MAGRGRLSKKVLTAGDEEVHKGPSGSVSSGSVQSGIESMSLNSGTTVASPPRSTHTFQEPSKSPTDDDDGSGYVNPRSAGFQVPSKPPASDTDDGSGYINPRSAGAFQRDSSDRNGDIWERGDSGSAQECLYCGGDHSAGSCSHKPQGNRGPPKCHNCQETGHMVRECPKPRSQYPRDNGFAGRNEARDRPQGNYGRGGGGGGYNSTSPNHNHSFAVRCANCEGKGHDASQCPSVRMSHGGGGGDYRGPSPPHYENSRDGFGHRGSGGPDRGGGGGGGGFRGSSPRHYDNQRDSFNQRGSGGSDRGGGGGYQGSSPRGGYNNPKNGYDEWGPAGGAGRDSYDSGRTSGGRQDSNRYEDRSGHQRDSRYSGNNYGDDHSKQGGHGAATGGGRDASENVCRRCNKTGHFPYECPARVGAKPEDADLGPYRHTIEVTEQDAVNRNQSGINFDRYDNVPVKVMDRNGQQDPTFEALKLRTFEDAALARELAEVIRKAGYEKPTPVQKYAIPIALRNRDLIACAQTGSGKTAAFVLPTMQVLLREGAETSVGPQSPLALILAPTRELVIQITKDAKYYGIRTQLHVKECYGGTHVGTQIGNLREGCHVLVGTTGRVKDFLQKGVITLERLRFLVFDEADRMLDMGFVNDIEEIGRYFSRNLRKPQTMMFSATFKSDVQSMARKFLADDYVKIEVGLVGAASEDVHQSIEEISGMNAKRNRLLEIIKEELSQSRKAKILVFVETKKDADFLATYLSEMSWKTTSIHGDRYQQQREEALQDFQSGECAVLVATSVAARGLDISGVTHVVNFDMPKEIEEYVHRVGRTGRVGNQGKATAFYDGVRDDHLRERLKEVLLDSGGTVPPFLGR